MKFVALIFAFFIIILLAFFTTSFISTQPVPDNSTSAGKQYENLTQTTDIAFTGINGAILLLIVAIVLAAVFVIIWAVNK